MLASVRIMIAEHDIRTRKNLAQYLGAQRGIEIHSSVDNGRDALFQLKNQPPDVLITDLVLPGYDGFALLEAIADNPALSNVKTIVLTSLMRDSFVERALSLGAYYYMCKPYEVSILYRRIMESVSDMEEIAENAPEQDTNSVRALLSKHGIPEGIKGYSYIISAVALGSNMKVINGRITKELYPEVARLHGTTSKNVERAIRNALTRGFEKTSTILQRPSNGEYIARLIQELATH